MTPKSLVYMVVAVFVGYMLVSAVPGQVAMYAVSTLSVEKGDTIILTGSEFSQENESSSVEENGSVVLYWDSVNTTDGRGFSPANESIIFETEDLSEFSEELDAISDVESIAADAVGEAAADAAKSVRSGLEFMGTMVWLSVDVLVALVVYWFAKRRFA